MTVFVNRSIPLSQESRDGWKNAGATIVPRNPVRAERLLARTNDTDIIINLGRGPEHLVGREPQIWNQFDTIDSIITPAAIRRTMPDLIPTSDVFNGPNNHRPYWIKGPGQHGNNKRLCQEYAWDGAYLAEIEHCLDLPGWDAQLHIEGTEFRVITVGNAVIQAYRKDHRTETNRGLMFQWNWIGVGGIKKNGLIPLVKKAAAALPHGDRSVVGWDCIVGEAGAYIIEGNSSPGVNDATAQRIVNAIER